MEDQPRPNPGQASDQTKRFTVAQAAQVLGINPEAVRSRIKRGTLESVKEGGTVYVMLDTDQTRPTVDPTSDQTQERVNVLIDSLQDQVTFLRGQLTAEREAHSEARRIIAALTQRIPELEPPREPRESSVTPSETSRGEEDRGDVREEPRSWWRRMFGA